jgi:hypothetical protein
MAERRQTCLDSIWRSQVQKDARTATPAADYRTMPNQLEALKGELIRNSMSESVGSADMFANTSEGAGRSIGALYGLRLCVKASSCYNETVGRVVKKEPKEPKEQKTGGSITAGHS